MRRSPSSSVPQQGEFRSYLRAINVRQDAEYPERIEHYHPTAKSTLLIRALAGMDPRDRAFIITAPYGSGKSLSAAFLLHLVENSEKSRAIVKKIANARLSKVSPEIAEWAKRRFRKRSSPRQGMVLALEGPQPSVAKGLYSALLESSRRVGLNRSILPVAEPETIDDAIGMLRNLAVTARAQGINPIVIVWDEFGRHLELLVAEGRAELLSDIQLLAEFVARQAAVTFTLGLLLHQGLLRYAGHLPNSVRAEWTKIEGRFQSIQYVDDSPEVYRLIAEIMLGRAAVAPSPAAKFAKAARSCKDYGLFSDLTQKELAALGLDRELEVLVEPARVALVL